MTDPQVIKISEPAEVDIIAYRGDDGGFIIEVNNDDDSPRDISTAVFDGDVRQLRNSTTVLANFTFTPVDGNSNQVLVWLPASEAQSLLKKNYYDIQMTLDDKTVTLIKGKVLAGEDVSRA